MSRNNLSALIPFLFLLFCGTVCSAMIVPFMAFYLVEGLGQDPWIISIYSVLIVIVTVTVNRNFGKRIDAGERVFPLVGVAAIGFSIATLSLVITPKLWVVLSIGVIGFGISSSSISTMFSLGGSLAERYGVERKRFNAYMRATTSTGWMIGPAITFTIADQFAPDAVFKLCLCFAVLWLGIWLLALPKDIVAAPKDIKITSLNTQDAAFGLWAAAAFVFCLSLAHSLTFSALPLFYVREVGLPGYAPGMAFSIKTFVEVFAIFATPFFIVRFGLRNSLLGTTLLAVIAIQVLASVMSFPQMIFGAALEGLYYGFYASLGISYVQSYATERPAQATAIYWNTLIVSGLLGGPAVGLIAQTYDFRTVILVASYVALFAIVILMVGSSLSNNRAKQR